MMYAMMAVSAAATVVAASEQSKAADQQTDLIQDGYEQERQQTLRQYQETTDVSQEQTSQRHREQMIEEGRLKAIGAESGLTGVSNDRIVSDANNQADQDLSTIEANRVRASEQVHSQGGSKQSAANIQMAGIKRPSALGTGLQIAGSAASIYSAGTSKVPYKR
jgi:hypothetical protein